MIADIALLSNKCNEIPSSKLASALVMLAKTQNGIEVAVNNDLEKIYRFLEDLCQNFVHYSSQFGSIGLKHR